MPLSFRTAHAEIHELTSVAAMTVDEHSPSITMIDDYYERAWDSSPIDDSHYRRYQIPERYEISMEGGVSWHHLEMGIFEVLEVFR